MAFQPPVQPQVNMLRPSLARSRKYTYIFHLFPNATLKGMVSGIEDVVMFSASRVSLSGGDIEEIQSDFINTREIKPGKYTPGELTVAIKVDEEAKVLEFIDAWRRTIYDPETGAMSKPEHYLCNGELEVVTVSGESVKKIEFNGLWLKPPTIDWDYSASEEQEVEVTMKYKYYLIK